MRILLISKRQRQLLQSKSQEEKNSALNEARNLLSKDKSERFVIEELGITRKSPGKGKVGLRLTLFFSSPPRFPADLGSPEFPTFDL